MLPTANQKVYLTATQTPANANRTGVLGKTETSFLAAGGSRVGTPPE